MDISRIHEKCANFVFLHSNLLAKNSVKLQLWPFLWSEFRKCDLSYESEEVFCIYICDIYVVLNIGSSTYTEGLVLEFSMHETTPYR